MKPGRGKGTRNQSRSFKGNHVLVGQVHQLGEADGLEVTLIFQNWGGFSWFGEPRILKYPILNFSDQEEQKGKLRGVEAFLSEEEERTWGQVGGMYKAEPLFQEKRPNWGLRPTCCHELDRTSSMEQGTSRTFWVGAVLVLLSLRDRRTGREGGRTMYLFHKIQRLIDLMKQIQFYI